MGLGRAVVWVLRRTVEKYRSGEAWRGSGAEQELKRAGLPVTKRNCEQWQWGVGFLWYSCFAPWFLMHDMAALPQPWRLMGFVLPVAILGLTCRVFGPAFRLAVRSGWPAFAVLLLIYVVCYARVVGA